MIPQSKAALEARVLNWVPVIGEVMGVVTCVVLVSISWGSNRARVDAVEHDLESKASKESVESLHSDVREIRVRVDQILKQLDAR